MRFHERRLPRRDSETCKEPIRVCFQRFRDPFALGASGLKPSPTKPVQSYGVQADCAGKCNLAPEPRLNRRH